VKQWNDIPDWCEKYI